MTAELTKAHIELLTALLGTLGFALIFRVRYKYLPIAAVGGMLTDLVSELKGFDADEGKGFLGFFRKQADKLESMKTKFAKAETNVAKIGDALEQHQMRLMKDSALLDDMYKQNLAYF